MTEESIVSKVGELMEALDNIKRYNAFARSLKKFALILVGSFGVFLVLRALIGFLYPRLTLDRPLYFLAPFLGLLIPILGTLAGILYVRRKVNSVRTGKWKEELSHGFPSALKILQELDWERTFDEISEGKLAYALYGVLKTAGFWFVTFFALGHLGDILIGFFLPRASLLLSDIGNLVWGLLALLIVLLILGDDLLRRYKEIRALDRLLWTLELLNLEFKRDEFKA